MRVFRHLLCRNIITCLLPLLTAACRHVPATDIQTPSFADKWHLTPQQRSELSAAKSALDVQYRRKILVHHEAKEASSKRLLSLVIQRAESGIGRKSELLMVQYWLSKDKIGRLQDSEQLRIAEHAFNNPGNGATSVEDVLSESVPTDLSTASEEEVFAALNRVPDMHSIPERQDLFSALWSRYETSKAINTQCRILDTLSSRIAGMSNESYKIGQLSTTGHIRVTRDINQQQFECIQHRHELDNIEVKLSILLNTRAITPE